MGDSIENQRVQLPYHHPFLPETQNASSDVAGVRPSLSSRNIKNLVIESSLPYPEYAIHQQQPIRRKPLSATASKSSPIVARYSSGEYLVAHNTKALAGPEQRYSRSYSVDSPTVYDYNFPQAQSSLLIGTVAGLKPPTKATTVLSQTAAAPNTSSSNFPPYGEPNRAAVKAGELKHPKVGDYNPAGLQTKPTVGLSEHYLELDVDEDPLSDLSLLDGYNSDSSNYSNPNSSNMSLFVTRKPTHLNLNQVDTPPPQPPPPLQPEQLTNNHDTQPPNSENTVNKLSPNSSSKLGTFFGWGTPSPSVTEFSDRGFSPLPSPYNASRNTFTDASPVTTIAPTSFLKTPTAQFGPGNSLDYIGTPPPFSPSHTLQIEEMEDELKAISAELAASIRREMDLEDLVDRLQSERDNAASTGNRRTSDYFSDSGYSSARSSEYDQSKEEIERIQRRAEQEKAQVRLDLNRKLQDERDKRKELDEQIQELSQRASRIDLAQLQNTDATGRVKELEDTCETLRRKLSEERQIKDNFEDLLSAIKGELQSAASERDNLRDEVVPQLRARVEGLESQAAEMEKMTYDSTKMQQELQVLKMENTSLKESRSMASIAEEPGSRLSRSNSVTGASSFKLQRPPSLSLSRSKSVKTIESREALSERLKDVEAQRDALHKALKALLERQECQNRENEKKIRVLEMERERIMTGSPTKSGYSKEVANLREEISVLRRRSEEALEQKWQVEKGLAGLKMDLDRAEEEITTLRNLLQEKDILIPPTILARSSVHSDNLGGLPVTSDSLMAAYSDLQKAHTDALARIKSLEAGIPQDERTQLAIEKLERSLTMTISERDLARQEASTYKKQLDALKAGEQAYLQSEKALADQLSESARRVEELSIQVRQQLATNSSLRQRLSDTVTRGEAEQKSNAERISAMQARLRTLEEQLVAAQTASEERVARHEEEIIALKENHNQHLGRLSAGGMRSPSPRLSSGMRSPRLFPPKSPLSPMFANGARSPRLSSTTSGPAMTVADEAQITTLKARVTELEKALAEADSEMQEVIGRMSTAQIQVMQLQEEREAAVNQTRKLERELQAEKAKALAS